jgi:four helix bundle protein
VLSIEEKEGEVVRCENLDVWKRSCRLSVEIYKYFTDCKDYGFKDQITRSSLSIGSNLAEGMEKDSDKEKVRYIEIAKGSGAELITQIYIGIEIGYIEKSVGIVWVTELKEILKMLGALKKNYGN